MKYNMRGVEGGGWPNIKKPSTNYVGAYKIICNCICDIYKA